MAADSLESSLLTAAADDWVSFAELVGFVREADIDSDAVDRAIAVAEDFAARGLWCAGDVTHAGFADWRVAPQVASTRIREALRTLRRPPAPGDICWFEITPKGTETFQRHA